MRWIDEHRIETPEQVPVDLELAGLGSRMVAQLVDWLFKSIAIAVLAIIAMVLAAFTKVATLPDSVMYTVLAVVGVIAYLLFMLYDIAFEARWNGQTPGKRFAGIRVVREGGSGLDTRAALIRGVLKQVDFLPSSNLLGTICILLTKNKQRLGDLAAGTIVIRERATGAPLEVEEAVEEVAGDDHRFGPSELKALQPSDRHVLRSFFLRYETMAAGPRDDLARKLARQMLDRTRYQPPFPIETGVDSTVFLAALLRDLNQLARQQY